MDEKNMDTGSKGLSLIEKIIVFKYYSLFLTIIFALDIFCLIAYKKNILDQFSNLKDNTFPFIYIVFFVIFFGFIMTICVPFLRNIIQSFFSYVAEHINDDDDMNRHSVSKDYVYVFAARKRAIETKDSFILSLVEKEEAMINEDERKLNILFALGGLCIFEFVINWSNNIIIYFYNLIQQETGIVFYLYNAMGLLFIGTITFLFWISIKPSSLEKMYLPESKEYNQKN